MTVRSSVVPGAVMFQPLDGSFCAQPAQMKPTAWRRAVVLLTPVLTESVQ